MKRVTFVSFYPRRIFYQLNKHYRGICKCETEKKTEFKGVFSQLNCYLSTYSSTWQEKHLYLTYTEQLYKKKINK